MWRVLVGFHRSAQRSHRAGGQDPAIGSRVLPGRWTVLGAILIGIIGNGMVLLGIPMEWEQVVTGTIIVAAVALDSLTRRRTRGTHG